MTYLTLFRKNIKSTMDAYRHATGCNQTRLDEIVSGYRTFSQTMERTDMRAGTYDKIMSRLSAIWPDGIAWPAGIERPEPAVLDAQTIKLVSEAIKPIAKTVGGIHPEWPPEQAWPSDIPMPATVEPTA
ncbi:hypothetical protein WKW50_05330 [Ochrobactrum sp. GPK 3]